MARARDGCVAIGLSALGACGRCGGEEGLSAPAPPVTFVEAGAPEAPEAPAPVPDLDLAELGGRLGCAGGGAGRRSVSAELACNLLERMKTSCRPFVAPPFQGRAQASWIGSGVRVEEGSTERGGKPRLEAVVLRAEPVEASLPGHLPLRFGILRRELSEGDPLSELAVAGPARLAEATQSAEALDLIRGLSGFGEVFATRTSLGRAYLLAERGGHLCEAEGGRGELLLVLRKASRIAPEDGLYAALLSVAPRLAPDAAADRLHDGSAP